MYVSHACMFYKRDITMHDSKAGSNSLSYLFDVDP